MTDARTWPGRSTDLIGDLLSLGAHRSPNRVLFSIVGGQSRTYAEVDERANRTANALLSAGLRPGDRIAVWADDSVEYLEMYMAAARSGLIMVPINKRLTGVEGSFITRDSGARALIVSDLTADTAAATLDPADFAVIACNGTSSALGAVNLEELVATGSPDQPPPPDEEDTFVIAYTSGTTGRPKGAMLSHRAVKNIARMNAVSYRLPLYSVAAYTGSMSFTATVCAFAMSHLYVGGTIVLLGKWNAEKAIDLVCDYGANFMYLPSPEIENVRQAILRRPQALETLTSILHSASKVSGETLKGFGEVVGSRLVEGWGMTEIGGGLVTATTAADFTGESDALDVWSSVGRATIDAAIEVVDDDRNPLPHDGNSYGELAIRSASMMTGYWNRPEDTARALVDGWYYSGDVGAMDPAGYVYIGERRSDMIVSGGMNVYPSEVESVISQLPQVQEVAVVGAPHERYGQTVAAAIVVSPGSVLTTDDVLEHCRDSLASYKKPTRVVFVDELPKTVSLKVKRAEIRAQLFGDG